MKRKKWLSCFLAFIMLFVVAVNATACGGNNVTPPVGGDTITVSWYDGRKELKSEELPKGSLATEWTPEKSGYEFRGWYKESSLTQEFDFSTPLERDTDIYSKWRSTAVEEDNRIWYAIGSLAGENWEFLTTKNDDGEWVKSTAGQKSEMQKYFFTNEGNNVYSITLSLRPNCKFQIVTNLIDKTTWEGDEGKGRMGLGNLKGFQYAEGIDPENGTVVTKDSGEVTDANWGQYGEVRDAEGNLVFYGGKEYDMPTYTWNIWPAEGSDGVYKFTFKSYPGFEDDNEIEWELIEKLEPLESFYEMYLTGNYHNTDNDGDGIPEYAEDWDDDPEADWCIHFEKEAGTTIHRAYITVTPDLYSDWSATENPAGVPAVGFKVKNYVTGLDYGCGGESGTPGSMNGWLTEGTWCITFDESNDVVTWERCEYYVIGTFKVGSTSYSFVVDREKITPKMTTTDNGLTYSATVNVPDVSTSAGYEWLQSKTSEGKSAVFAVKAVLGCRIGIKDTFAAADAEWDDPNLYFYATGTYTVTYTVANGTITAEKISDDYTDLKPVSVYYYEVVNGKARSIYEEQLLAGDEVVYRPTGRLGFKFDGWYYDEQCSSKFGGTIGDEPVALYCRFVEGFDLDTNDYYIVGSGVSGGTLGTYGTFTSLVPQMKMQRQDTPDADGLTVYTLEMTIYNGDAFKVVRNLSWIAGTHWGYGEMRDDEGRFNGSGVGNIILRTNNDGKYVIKFHSNPYNPTDNYIDYEFKEAVAAKDTYKMYVIGNIEGTGWNNYRQNQNYCLPMTRGEDGVTWTVTAHFVGGDYFKVWNSQTKGFFPDGTGDDIYIGVTPDPDVKDGFVGPDGTKYTKGDVLPGTGWYTISWSQDDPTIVVTPLDSKPESEANKQVMYLIGNFEANGNDSSWATNSTDKMLAMIRDDCGYTWSVTAHFKAGDQFKIYQYYSASAGVWIPDGYNGSQWDIKTAGTYTITWNYFTGAVTITEAQATNTVAAMLLKVLSNVPLYNSRRFGE